MALDLSSLNIPTMDEIAAARVGKPIAKGQTRVEQRAEQKPLTKVDERAFLATVRKRDNDRCRWCGRKVIYTLKRTQERGEVHHIHGRRGDLRFEDRSALLLCLLHHERVTGRVNEKYTIVASATYTVRGETYTDARQPVTFVRVA